MTEEDNSHDWDKLAKLIAHQPDNRGEIKLMPILSDEDFKEWFERTVDGGEHIPGILGKPE